MVAIIVSNAVSFARDLATTTKTCNNLKSYERRVRVENKIEASPVRVPPDKLRAL